MTPWLWLLLPTVLVVWSLIFWHVAPEDPFDMGYPDSEPPTPDELDCPDTEPTAPGALDTDHARLK